MFENLPPFLQNFYKAVNYFEKKQYQHALNLFLNELNKGNVLAYYYVKYILAKKEILDKELKAFDQNAPEISFCETGMKIYKKYTKLEQHFPSWLKPDSWLNTSLLKSEYDLYPSKFTDVFKKLNSVQIKTKIIKHLENLARYSSNAYVLLSNLNDFFKINTSRKFIKLKISLPILRVVVPYYWYNAKVQ